MTKNKINNETSVVCPNCGAEFAIPEHTSISVGVVIGKDAGLGTISPELAEPKKKSAKDRLEALREAGVDVSNMFAMQGANGGEHIACSKDGKLTIMDDNDPIFQQIRMGGTVPNRRLFRRWVMAQMFYMMTRRHYHTKHLMSVTEVIHRLGYEYQWKMLINELNAQAHMEQHKDIENLCDRKRWFNEIVAYEMAIDYINKLEERIKNLPSKNCKGVPYKTIAGRNIFVEDIHSKVLHPLHIYAARIRTAHTASKLYDAVVNFWNLRVKMPWETPQCSVWIDAYKGSGAYFTLQNMIRFHHCFVIDDCGRKLYKDNALQFIQGKAITYCNGEGWRMMGVLKKCLQDNDINLEQKIASWRKR